MANRIKYEDLSNEKLKKLLLTYRLFSVLVGVSMIAVLVYYFLNRDELGYTLLVVGMALGVVIDRIVSIANKIKKEIKNRDA